METPDSWKVTSLHRVIIYRDGKEHPIPVESIRDVQPGTYTMGFNILHKGMHYECAANFDVDPEYHIGPAGASVISATLETAITPDAAEAFKIASAELAAFVNAEIIPDLQSRLAGLDVKTLRSKPK